MSALDDAKKKAAATYNAASDCYDDPVNSFWPRFGRQTVERLGIPTGASVLDVCCGSGWSAIAAAEQVGSTGSVLGVDLADDLLALARAKAAERSLRNVQFRVGDMLELGLPPSSFDAVVCVFGIFFVPDMVAAVRSLWSVLRSGGTLAITTWGPRFFEPGSSAFWKAIQQVRPDLYRGFNPWDRICDPSSLDALLREAGITNTKVVAESGRHTLASPDDWWSAVMGSGYRGTMEQLSPTEAECVRSENIEFIRANDIDSIEANVVFATAIKASAQA